MTPPPQLVCACGKPAEMFCFFSDGDAHGVCEHCGMIRLIELETGQIVSRWVCDQCWRKRRSRSTTSP